MAKIKSTIELAMERTKEMIPSASEKEKIREEEVRSKAQILVNRFLHVALPFKEVEKELAQYDPEHRKKIEGIMLRCLGEAIHLDADNNLAFQGIEALRGKNKDIILKIQELAAKYEAQRAKEYQKIEETLMLKLHQQGISGSAVQPKVEESPEWNVALSRFRPLWEKQLGELIERLQS